MAINVKTSSCKVPVILVGFQRNLNFLNIFSKNAQILNFIKILPVGADLFHAEWQPDVNDEANGRFRNFAKSAKNWKK
jgi:hypothetical protein